MPTGCLTQARCSVLGRQPAGNEGQQRAGAVTERFTGELEVSLLLHGHHELVGEDFRDGDWQAAPRPHLLVTGMRGRTESGVIGRSLVSAERGRTILASLARS